MASPEFTEVEQPFLNQLVQMGWTHTTSWYFSYGRTQ
jgi:hypothetical protein